MGLFRFGKKHRVYYYSERDQIAYEKMLETHFGTLTSVMHEIVSPDLHIDVIPIPPSTDRNYYTLFTMGMGAYKMRVPSDYGRMNRAEMAIRLPADWNIHSDEGRWYWPIRVIKTLARLPYYEKSYLGLYHDIDFVQPFSEETELCGILLDIFDPSLDPMVLENGDQLVLYNVIPIYRAEMEYKNSHGAAALLEKLDGKTVHGPVDIRRKSAV